MRGSVHFFDGARRWGFIDHEQHRYFVHAKNLKCRPSELQPGVVVDFEVWAGAKGLEAHDVTVVADVPKVRGRLKRWFGAKAYGFAVCDDGTQVFVHARNFLKGGPPGDIQPGALLQFVVGPTNRGPNPEALAIEVVDE